MSEPLALGRRDGHSRPANAPKVQAASSAPGQSVPASNRPVNSHASRRHHGPSLLTGIIPAAWVKVVACHPIGQEAVNLVFKGADGRLQERMLFRSDEPHITIAVEGRPWGLDGSADDLSWARKRIASTSRTCLIR